MKGKKTLAIAVAVLFFFISLGLILYPAWSSWYTDNHQAELELQYQEQLNEKDDSVIKDAWSKAEAYNKAIIPGTQNETAFTQEAQLKAAQNYGSMLNVNEDSIMGYVEIPKINVNLPVYHGTDDNTLERGLGHLVGSSLPIGGKGSHAIITGHSGLAGKRMFTDLEDLDSGDVFYIKVLGETLAYKVDQIKVVLPHEIADLKISAEEDYVTLITCTPYAVNSHRLLVRGTRVPHEVAEEIVEQTPVEEKALSTWEKGYLKGILWGLALAVFLVLSAFAAQFIIKKIKAKKLVIAPTEEVEIPEDREA